MVRIYAKALLYVMLSVHGDGGATWLAYSSGIKVACCDLLYAFKYPMFYQ